MSYDLYKDETSRIRYYILSYLTENPEAGDTEEGIKWWLMDRWIKFVSPNVQAVLNALRDEELILEHKRSDSQVHYLLNKSKHEEIQAFLEQNNK